VLDLEYVQLHVVKILALLNKVRSSCSRVNLDPSDIAFHEIAFRETQMTRPEASGQLRGHRTNTHTSDHDTL
jgi:hypothetical protein